MLQESGLYQYETQKSITPNGFGREIDRRIPVEYSPEPIVIDEIKGVLFLFLIGLGSSSAVILIEIIVHIAGACIWKK